MRCCARDDRPVVTLSAAGVAHLHSNGIMHNDIKSLNFLVDKDLRVKLADLGESRQIPRWDPRNPMQGVLSGSAGREDDAGADAISTPHEKESPPRIFPPSSSLMSPPSSLPSIVASPSPKALPQNVNWSAPEVLLGHQDVRASSVTSMTCASRTSAPRTCCCNHLVK